MQTSGDNKRGCCVFYLFYDEKKGLRPHHMLNITLVCRTHYFNGEWKILTYSAVAPTAPTTGRLLLFGHTGLSYDTAQLFSHTVSPDIYTTATPNGPSFYL